MEFPVPLLNLLQLQSYLVLCISARVFIIPKLQNIHCRQSIGEISFLCIEHFPNCYSVRPIPSFPVLYNFSWSRAIGSDGSFREHLSSALPTKMIFCLLRSIRSEQLIGEYSAELMLEIIIKWLQVSVSECN
jgi:hypothetical protein